MATISKKVIDRITANLKIFQAIAESQRVRDVSEADTVTLVKDILSACFGYDKYAELTSEYQIRNTYCDLAVKIDGQVKYLIEVKAAGVTLSDSHLRQAVEYGAREGIAWVVLTNAIEWRLHRVKFGDVLDHEEVSSFTFTTVSAKNPDDIKRMFLLCREGLSTDAMTEFHEHAQMLNRFTIAQVVLMDGVVASIRKEMRRIFPDLKISPEAIIEILRNDVLKRDVIESEKFAEAQNKIKKLVAKQNRALEKAGAKAVVSGDITKA